MRGIAAIALAAVGVVACDNGIGPEGPEVSVAFESRPGTTGATGATGASPGLLAIGGGGTAASILVTGTNGQLFVDTVHVVLNAFELERVEREDDCDASGTGNPCRRFEVSPLLADLPVGNGPRTAMSAAIPAGEYDELEFEIEDLEDDEMDPVKAQRIEELLEDVRERFADWPRGASMRVAGTFTPEGGEPRSFVVFFAAETEVELEFDTPFVVRETDLRRTLTVELDPRDWFTLPDGTVMNLAEHDHARTGDVVEFQVEIENGFKRVEHDG